MTVAPRIELRAPREARARYLVDAYRDIVENREALEAALTRLPVAPSPKRLASWRAMAEAGDFASLAEALIELHYDPAYNRSSRKETRRSLGAVALSDLEPASRAAATDEIARLVSETFQTA
jgi:tRNA 2-selenouridine synthase